MSFDELLGRRVRLPIARFGSPGAHLTTDAGDVLLPGSEIPEGATEGDLVDVFLYKDSSDRPVATMQAPKLALEEVTFLEVKEVGPFGAFVDWGLGKDLLVPFAEQTVDMRAGSRYPIGLYVDKSGRLAGTMRVAEMLDARPHDFRADDWVDGEAWRNDPAIGLFVILERAFVGLVPGTEPHRLTRGEAARFRVANVLPDGKLELSLRGLAQDEVEGDAKRILAVLAHANAPEVSDKTSPERIRALFGVSKKAFKRAVGRLLKEGALTLEADGSLKSPPAQISKASRQ